MPAPADQTPAIAYALYSEEPIRTPGGGLIMPDLLPEVRSRKARLERLSESASWAEIVLLDWFKRIAVFGVSMAPDMDRFERATQSLWRLTAIAKSIFALEDNPNRPIPPELEAEVGSLLSGAGVLSASSPIPTTNPAPIHQDESLGPRTVSSATPPPAAHSAPAPQEAPPPAAPSPSASPDSPNAISALHTPLAAPPIASPSLPPLAVSAVPSCPTLSLSGIDTYLTRTEADLAEAKRPTPPILNPTSIPAKPIPSPSSFPPPSPSSALPTPLSENPQSCSSSCVQCAKPHCARRTAVPFHHQPRVLKCEGICRECSKTRTCPFTPAYLRPG